MSNQIKRRWVDADGCVWYVTGGTLAETGYPQPEERSRVGRSGPVHRFGAYRSPFPELAPLSGPSSEELQQLLYRARITAQDRLPVASV